MQGGQLTGDKVPSKRAYRGQGCQIERHALDERIEQVFDWLSQLQSAEGEIEQAIATVERWRCFDPLNEDISLRLMQLQFVTGNRIAALKTYETYQDVLMTELWGEGRRGVSYHFSHDKIREVVYAAAGDARRRVFHGRALMVLEHVDVPTAELASHALANGAAALTFQ